MSKAFALCEVDHTIDRIRHYGDSQDHMSFISSSTVDLETGRGEQWYTAVPWVRCANLLEAYPYETMVAKGDHLPFYVALRNDGNCHLTGVELTVAEANGADIGTIHLDFGEDNMVASEWNPPNEDGTLQNVEDDWALAPGTTSRYYAESVTIPEDWEGPKQLEVYVTAAYGSTVRTEGGIVAEASKSSIEFLPDKRTTTTIKLPGGMILSTGTDEPELTRADVREVGNSNDDSGSNDGGNGGAGGGGTNPNSNNPAGHITGGSGTGPGSTNQVGSSRSTLASTGDNADSVAQAAARCAIGGLMGLAAGAALHAKRKQRGE